jgi:hypothetical protein
MMFMVVGVLGCASTPAKDTEPANYGFKNGNRVWVRGPWKVITPSMDIDAVIDQLCPAVMALPRATFRDYGQEYCGAIYPMADGMYYASIPSPLAKTVLVGPSKRKTCIPPSYVEDDRGSATPTADFHSHPWAPSSLSPIDALAKTQLWTIRIQFDSVCHTQKLIPYKNENRPGEVYERQGKTWKLIGLIKPEDKEYGIITPIHDAG